MKNMSDDDIIAAADRWNKGKLDFERQKWADKKAMLRGVGKALLQGFGYLFGTSVIISIFVLGKMGCEAGRKEKTEAMDLCVQKLDAETCAKISWTPEEGTNSQLAAYHKCLEAIGAEKCNLLD